jgi:hypothetical protein
MIAFLWALPLKAGLPAVAPINEGSDILSTSFEEAGRDIEATVKKLSGYDILVFACQAPKLSRLHHALKNASFRVADVHVENPKRRT